MTLHFLFQYFGTVPSCCLHYKRFFLYEPGRYIQCGCVSQRKYVTMDETWIHRFTPESNWQIAEWAAADETHLK